MFTVIYLPTAEEVYMPYFQDSICNDRVSVEEYVRDNDCVFGRGVPGDFSLPWFPGHPVSNSPYKIPKHLLEIIEVPDVKPDLSSYRGTS
jgi:hypothetical protein